MNPWQLDPQLANDSHPLVSGDLCDVRLMDDANYPWLILVPRVADACELFDLNANQRRTLIEAITDTENALKDLFAPDKLNVAALGNVVPQLHVHVIARYTSDPAWPSPVWGRTQARPYTPEQLSERSRRLIERLG
ncbi:MAG: HIT family protein [Xanthomonadaceae bacterium]|nr:HIT family protein [Xanthomonadaceae bacterium]MDP2184182.1 HIT family protein [Xanthomonadales bacterium]MDZ4114727.1 HIT family protein [Xanthomonadaceae bacterium]MDZ4377335.1 HIT family protein [Xanthomonadaceae bacterium]